MPVDAWNGNGFILREEGNPCEVDSAPGQPVSIGGLCEVEDPNDLRILTCHVLLFGKCVYGDETVRKST